MLVVVVVVVVLVMIGSANKGLVLTQVIKFKFRT